MTTSTKEQQPGPAAGPDDRDRDQTDERLRLPPKESGMALMGFGIVGVLLLDPADIFLVAAGALVFTPSLFGRTERWMQVRFPKTHREGRRHLDRFIDAFESRYPPEPHPAGRE
jgi:hypothetical protein